MHRDRSGVQEVAGGEGGVGEGRQERDVVERYWGSRGVRGLPPESFDEGRGAISQLFVASESVIDFVQMSAAEIKRLTIAQERASFGLILVRHKAR